MAQRKKKRTSIRTAAGTTQRALLQRLRDLRDDPLRVLPDCPHGEPKAVAKVRQGLERVAAGRVGFRARRDKGVVGAVVQSLPLADQESLPRVIDHKVGGQRRFYLQRGHVARGCMLGVQNHDDPRALLMAYRALAKDEGLHFFAVPGLTCTGDVPLPPEAWVQALAERAGITLTADGDDWTCDHPDRLRVRLGFRGGPDVYVCGPCGKSAGNLHALLRNRYAGPRERHPVDVDVVLPDGSHETPPDEDLAAYRAGVQDEKRLIQPVLLAWREQARNTVRFVLGQRDLGDDQDAFLDALGLEDWMRDAVAAMTRDGHVGRSERLGSVLEANAANAADAVRVLLGDDADRFLARHGGLGVQDLLQRAHDEAEGRARVADLPDLSDLGPVGALVDDCARTVRRDGRAAGIDWLRRNTRLADQHRYALLLALGGDLGLDRTLDDDAKDAGRELEAEARTLMEATGDAYRDALAAYLDEAGVGESVA